MGKLLNSISERRIRLGDKYKLYLEVPEKEFLTVYSREISVKNGRDALSQYLNYHQDEARIDDVKIKHDKNNHSINIEADLYYVGNKHTDQNPVPPYLNH
ncbi:MAG: hypothetical protein PWQ37_1012 [Candidatus Petromonas sp.]|nr:hypothetical protein [Candidatus Petromonas sp.]